MVRDAKETDIDGINSLLELYNIRELDREHINDRDVSLVYHDMGGTGTVGGFLWCGLMANCTYGYIDKYALLPEHQGKGAGQELAKALKERLLAKGCKNVFGIIKQADWHHASAINGLKMGMEAHVKPYTYISGEVK
jgi:N-acetylglutamate synthase-like GNAT family acetyltransferase